MVLNSDSVKLIRRNAERLANSVKSKEELVYLVAANTFEGVFEAIETILTNTDMYFDDELLSVLEESNFQSFKATLLVYTFNIINKKVSGHRNDFYSGNTRPVEVNKSAIYNA